MDAIIQHLIEAFKYIIDSVDWVYLVIYMLTAYIVLKGFGLQNKEKKEKFTLPVWLFKTRWIVLGIGVFYALLFSILKIFDYLTWHNPEDVPYGFMVFFSFILGQFLNLYGIEKLVDAIIAGVNVFYKHMLNKFKTS